MFGCVLRVERCNAGVGGREERRGGKDVGATSKWHGTRAVVGGVPRAARIQRPSGSTPEVQGHNSSDCDCHARVLTEGLVCLCLQCSWYEAQRWCVGVSRPVWQLPAMATSARSARGRKHGIPLVLRGLDGEVHEFDIGTRPGHRGELISSARREAVHRVRGRSATKPRTSNATHPRCAAGAF